MTKRAGRFISLLLSLCLLLGLLPTALAAEPELTRAELALMIYEKFLPAAPDDELGHGGPQRVRRRRSRKAWRAAQF